MGRGHVCPSPEDRACRFQVRVVTRAVMIPEFGDQAAFLGQAFFAHGYQTYIILNTLGKIRSLCTAYTLGQASTYSVKSWSESLNFVWRTIV